MANDHRVPLADAVVLGDAMARKVMYEVASRETGVTAFPGTHWEWVFYVKPRQETEYYSELDERLQYTYGAICPSPALGVKKAGPGGNYVQAFRDSDENHFDGAKSYRLHMPANPSAAAFWSITAYDSATRSMVQNPTNNDAAHSSYDELTKNDDGSYDLYFGPTAPEGKESNWIETVPGRGFHPMFRLYSPTEPLFDGTWSLPNVDRI